MSRRPRILGGRVVAVLSSYALACVVLLLLFVLTWFGTLEQTEHSIYDVQRKYFESFVLVHWAPLPLVGDDVLPVPLPGAYLLLCVLALNLVLGGLVRVRKTTATVGVLVAHSGILLLLLGGLVEYQASTKGSMALVEGDTADEFQSYFDWDLVAIEKRADGSTVEHVMPHERLAEAADAPVVFTAKDLPFDVVVRGWMRNAWPEPGREPGDVVLRERPPDPEKAEHNLPGLVATVVAESGERMRAAVWGGGRFPFAFDVGERRFGLDLRRRRWRLPFAIELVDFVHRRHPGVSTPAEYSSHVLKREGGVARRAHITMNEPLRHAGYTLYQSGVLERDRGSVFAVVKNPADRFPLVACLVIALGLLVQFALKLYRFIQRGLARGRS